MLLCYLFVIVIQVQEPLILRWFHLIFAERPLLALTILYLCILAEGLFLFKSFQKWADISAHMTNCLWYHDPLSFFVTAELIQILRFLSLIFYIKTLLVVLFLLILYPKNWLVRINKTKFLILNGKRRGRSFQW